MSSLKDRILAAAASLPSEDVDVPGWGEKVKITGLSAKQRDQYYSQQVIERGGKPVGRDTSNATAKLLVLCIRDMDGELVFGPEHVDMLGDQPAAVLDELFEIAARLSGLNDEDTEDLGKDSLPTLNGVSPSSSPGTSRSGPAKRR